MRQEMGPGATTRPERQVGVLAIAIAVVPLVLSACTSTETKSAFAEKPVAGTADAYGYAPARVMDFADGTRIALPTAKPDVAKIADAKAAVAAATAVPARPAPVGEAAEVAALKADVAERRAQQASQAIAELSAARQSFKPAAATPVATKPGAAAPVVTLPAPAAKPAVPAQAAAPSAIETVAAIAAVPAKGARAVAGGARQAASTTIETVGEGVEAARDVTVAAIDTTVVTAKRVKERIGDTFKGIDSITGSSAIDRMIEEAAVENNIPSNLAYAVVRVESHYNPTAVGGGAYGLSQIKPATARGLGFSGPAKGLFDPATNLRYGMKYLSGAWEKSGHDICGTAMRYKGGHRTTRMTKAASIYCSNVKRHMAAIERRRGPVNHGTLSAAAEREKTVALASHAALPGVPMPTSRAILAAAGSEAGRRVAGTAPVSVSTAPAFAASGSERGGRVVPIAID